MSALRIIVADDHPMFRQGLATTVDGLDGAQVVGQAGSGEEAVHLVHELAPDVVLMDLHMPSMDGIEATRRIVEAQLPVAVLVVSMLDDDESVFAALRAGARGYLLKDTQRAEIARALEAVAGGEMIFGPAIARRVLAFFHSPKAVSPAAARPFPDLTEREREILDLVAQGLTNETIAARLVLSRKTVRNHVSNVFGKLRVADRSAAIVKARDAGFGS